MKFLAVMILAILARPAFGDEPGRASEPSTFELLDGDRVVFLGNTFVERMQRYGHVEAALTARWPERNITFRNLGWSGDTVWAESRGLFDPPAKGYARMLEHVERLKPTVVFLGYGSNEAFAGEAGLPAFVKQYEKLLDDLTQSSAEGVRFVLFAPFHEPMVGYDVDPARSDLVDAYSDAIEKLAGRRDSHFVRVHGLHFKTRALGLSLTEDGQHFNVAGQVWFANQLLDHTMDGEPSRTVVRIDSKNGSTGSRGVVVSDVEHTPQSIRFQVRPTGESEHLLPTPLHVVRSELSVAGLPPGRYRLVIDGSEPRGPLRSLVGDGNPGVLDDETVAKGFEYWDPRTDRLEALRAAIVEKNRLYFQSWRPQNVTYLTLFRKHEQGNNAKELEEFARLVAEKEAEIAKLRRPVKRTYELTRVKPKTTTD